MIGQLGQTLDGRIATRTGESRYINGQCALDHLHLLRASVDAVLVGAGTIVADDPQLNVRRTAGRNPARVALDPSGRTPAGLQLTELKVLPDTLSLKGQARDPGALQRINTLVLALQRSPFIEAQGLKLRSASRLDPKDTANDRQPPLELVAFELTAPFRERDSRREAALLRQLEAQGMAARLQVLEREGLLP